MKLSNLEEVNWIQQTRSRVRKELETLELMEKNCLLSEISFLGVGLNERYRIFSDDGRSTRSPLKEDDYREFSRQVRELTRQYLCGELQRCDASLEMLGVKLDGK